MTDIVEKLLRMIPVDILGGKPMLLNPDGPAAVHEIDQLRNEIINFRTEIERLREALDVVIYDSRSAFDENTHLRKALKETLAIARRNELGDYIQRAEDALERK